MKLPTFTKSKFTNYLAGYWTVFSSIYLLLITFVTIPTTSVRFADTILGVIVGTVITTIINYYLGNSLKESNTHEISTNPPVNFQVRSDTTIQSGSEGQGG